MGIPDFIFVTYPAGDPPSNQELQLGRYLKKRESQTQNLQVVTPDNGLAKTILRLNQLVGKLSEVSYPANSWVPFKEIRLFFKCQQHLKVGCTVDTGVSYVLVKLYESTKNSKAKSGSLG